ncbi:hypothetical protein A3J17_03925 [Candidatus Curtissbacteria bacterium RIFCSPLOWO2_02_FULL_40_11]|nr:MAG: hypothetical protein A3J17_03925 [Candidatus Curtissbacteria bacterium RIFCSPLOWO2_02_FULL_40_11]
MISVESKIGLEIPDSGDTQSAPDQRKLKRRQPIIVDGNRITTTVPGHPDDNFGAVNTSTGQKTTLSSHQREAVYGLQNRKHVPPELAEGLRVYRRIKKRKQQEKTKRKPPIYAPFEDPPEIE